MPGFSLIDTIVEQLMSGNEDVREAAALELSALCETGLSEKDGLRAIEAATRRFPSRRIALNEGKVQIRDSAADLMHAAAARPRPGFGPRVVELFSRFGEETKVEALELLARLPDRTAAVAYVDLARRFAGELPRLPIATLQCELRHADVFLPSLLDLADDPLLGLDVCEVCLAYCDAGLVAYAPLRPYAPGILELYRHRKSKLAMAQAASASTDDGAELKWMWEEDYRAARHEASLLLDLLGHFPTPEVAAELQQALGYRDPRLKHFAVVSLLRQGIDVPQAHIDAVAASAEMRNWLHDNLEQLLRGDLFPARFRKQEAFAESELVGWLTHPDELGQPPDTVELMKVIPIDTASSMGVVDYFVFRFRVDEPHWAAERGFMAGVAGPYLERDTPTTKAYGGTHSAYESWDSRTAEEHVGDLGELTSGWRAYAKAHA